MGLCSYYRMFVPGFATLAEPLIQLTEKNSAFRWTEKEREAFNTLKEKLTTPPFWPTRTLPGPSSWTEMPLAWASVLCSPKTSMEKIGLLLMAAGC